MTIERTGSSSNRAPVSRDAPDVLDIARAMLRLLAGGGSDDESEDTTIRDGSDHEEGSAPEGPRDPDVAGAAAVFGLTLASSPGLYERLIQEAPIVVVECPADHWADPLEAALSRCLGRRGSSSLRRVRSKIGSDWKCGAAVIRGRRGVAGEADGRSAVRAIRDLRPIVAIVGPQKSRLPDDVERACEARLPLAALTPEALSLVVAHVTGCEPSTQASTELAAAAEPADLRVAIHPARGPDLSLKRLAQVVGARARRPLRNAGPRLSQLPGYGAAAEWGLAAATDLAAYRRGEIGWVDLDPGILLVGPPGTGKSSFAAALAREADVPFVAGSLAQWHASGAAHLGTTLQAMRKFFEEARKAAPCIALVDELDSFGDRGRFGGDYGHYWVQLVNGLLECLDGAVERTGVILVGTTNATGRIDPAILRAGRFDRVIAIGLPSCADLAAILRHHLGSDLPGADLTALARQGLGGTGADCAAWVRRARGRARRDGRTLEEGDLLREIAGSGSQRCGDSDWRIAVHECGHVVVARALGLPVGDVVLRSLASDVEGFCRLRPPEILTLDAGRTLLAVLMGGRAAEIVVFGMPSAGAAGDLAGATALACDMHSRWGLGGSLVVRDRLRGAAVTESCIERELRRASRAAIRIIAARRQLLDQLSRSLLEHRSLGEAEIAGIAGDTRRPAWVERNSETGPETPKSQEPPPVPAADLPDLGSDMNITNVIVETS